MYPRSSMQSRSSEQQTPLSAIYTKDAEMENEWVYVWLKKELVQQNID
jgi:hypothetical protein